MSNTPIERAKQQTAARHTSRLDGNGGSVSGPNHTHSVRPDTRRPPTSWRETGKLNDHIPHGGPRGKTHKELVKESGTMKRQPPTRQPRPKRQPTETGEYTRGEANPHTFRSRQARTRDETTPTSLRNGSDSPDYLQRLSKSAQNFGSFKTSTPDSPPKRSEQGLGRRE